MRVGDKVFRSWYYFRLGYGTYLTFVLGYGSTLVTVYYLAIRSIPGLLNIFPSFTIFAVIATLVAIPIAVAIGWIHAKRSGAYISEAEIGIEANPWNYKIPAGISVEVIYPMYRELVAGLQELMEKQGVLDAPRRERLEELLRKLDVLLAGGIVGKPRTKYLRPSDFSGTHV